MTDATGEERNAEVSMLDSLFNQRQLNDKIEFLELEKTKLKTRLQQLQEETSHERKKQTDLVWFYRQENEKKDKAIEKLTEQNNAHIADKRSLKEKFDENMKNLKEQHTFVKQELQDHLDALTRDNASLRDFREHKVYRVIAASYMNGILEIDIRGPVFFLAEGA